MSRKNHHHVLVAGAGPAGLAAALFLQQRGIDVDVIEERWHPPDDDVLVILHADTAERLGDAGARIDLAHVARAIDTIVVHDGSRIHATLPIGEVAAKVDTAAVVPLRIVRDSIATALQARHVKVQWHRRLARIDATTSSVVADIEVLDRDSAGYAISGIDECVSRIQYYAPAYLIAADGRESVVRTQLRIGWRAIGPATTVAAFEFESRWDPGREVHLLVGDHCAVLWPGPEGRLRLTFHGSDAGPTLDTERAPDRDVMMALLHDLRWMDLPVGKLLWSQVERVEQGVAEPTHLGPTWLVGEAAHRLLPLASQSLNHGIRMAHDLAATIDDVARGQGGGELLARHATRSQAQALRVAQVGDLYQPAVGADGFIAANYRRILPLVPAHGRDLDAVAARLGLQPRAL